MNERVNELLNDMSSSPTEQSAPGKAHNLCSSGELNCMCKKVK